VSISKRGKGVMVEVTDQIAEEQLRYLQKLKEGVMKAVNLLVILCFVVVSGIFIASSEAAQVCFDIASFCNDMKLITSDVAPDGSVTAIYGYEYGCGQDDRTCSGSMRKSGTHKIYTFTCSYNNGSQVKSESIDYDKATGTATGGWNYNGGTPGTASYTKVSCASVTSLGTSATEPDSSQLGE
jgi:hypothetical protein